LDTILLVDTYIEGSRGTALCQGRNIHTYKRGKGFKGYKGCRGFKGGKGGKGGKGIKSRNT